MKIFKFHSLKFMLVFLQDQWTQNPQKHSELCPWSQLRESPTPLLPNYIINDNLYYITNDKAWDSSIYSIRVCVFLSLKNVYNTFDTVQKSIMLYTLHIITACKSYTIFLFPFYRFIYRYYGYMTSSNFEPRSDYVFVPKCIINNGCEFSGNTFIFSSSQNDTGQLLWLTSLSPLFTTSVDIIIHRFPHKSQSNRSVKCKVQRVSLQKAKGKRFFPKAVVEL
jgi:hypothetical protein